MKTTIKFLFFAALMAISCNSDSDSTDNSGANQDTSVTADAKAQGIEEDIEDIKEDVLANDGYYASKNENTQLPPSSCRVISQETLTNGDKKFKVDFGTGCTDNNGNNRSGIIYIVVHRDNSTHVITANITFDNYYINSNKIEGTINVSRSVVNNIPTYTRETNINIIQPASGGTIHREGNFTIEKTGGASTPLVFTDDVFSIDGEAYTTLPNGTLLHMEITEPLIRNYNCLVIVKGKKTLTKNSLTYTLDYGNGTCDNIAILTLPGGSTVTIYL
ncbi:hypothetical protein [Flavobacterium cerinum]|uniref:Lipocalin-like domain-containing protein n=1 Tax=Flavobacterium cerinum TaxID=2502784 RepID=A0ABY5IYA9_9FLAO|nr:hypothetical protein [Flavobacterium cerinum]UUC46472.1 hypothetical protein NOX80_04535 [Flavobacterium cerinum]